MPGVGAIQDTCGCDGWFVRKFGDLPMRRLRLFLDRLTVRHDWLLARRDVEELSLIQVYRLGSPLPRHLDQRRNVLIRDTTMEGDVCLNCRPAKIPVEDRLGRFQAHSLIAAVEQLAQPLDSARR